MVNKESEKHKKEIKKLQKESVDLKRKLKKLSKGYVREVRDAVSTALLAAFALLMALSWREVIVEWMASFTQVSPLEGSLFSAMIVTFFSVLGIIIVTRYVAIKKDSN